MDKKKVKELIEQILDYCDQCYNPNWQPKSFEEFVKLGNICMEAIEELSKSDWVSVENRLPEYSENVLVTTEVDTNLVWITTREKSSPWLDSNSFVNHKKHFTKITHWKPIEKLEE